MSSKCKNSYFLGGGGGGVHVPFDIYVFLYCCHRGKTVASLRGYFRRKAGVTNMITHDSYKLWTQSCMHFIFSFSLNVLLAIHKHNYVDTCLAFIFPRTSFLTWRSFRASSTVTCESIKIWFFLATAMFCDCCTSWLWHSCMT